MLTSLERASEALNLLLHVNPCYDQTLEQEQILHELLDLFCGLGKLPGTYHIDMERDAKPAQGNPQRMK